MNLSIRWNRYALGVVFASSILATASDVRAGTQYWHGNSCQLSLPEAAPGCRISFNTYGPNCFGNSGANLTCPLGFDGSAGTGGTNLYQVFMNVYNRNSSDNVYCTLYVVDYGGNPIYTGTRSTSSWSWSPLGLSWFALNVGALWGELECHLPANNQGYSHIATYSAQWN